MQSAKRNGTMPCILILPPGGETDSKTDKKSQSQEEQPVTVNNPTDSAPRHKSCNSHTQSRDHEIKDEENK